MLGCISQGINSRELLMLARNTRIFFLACLKTKNRVRYLVPEHEILFLTWEDFLETCNSGKSILCMLLCISQGISSHELQGIEVSIHVGVLYISPLTRPALPSL
jgi:hypothetical protein